MPFDSLQPRLGSIPVQPVPHFNVPPVMPIGDIIDHGLSQVAGVLDTFNPLNQQERRAKIALATMQTYAMQQAQAGNWEPYMKLHGHFQNMQEENLKLQKLKNELEMQGITLNEYKKRKAEIGEAFGPSPGVRPPTKTNNTFHKAIEDITDRASGIIPTPWAPPTPNAPTPDNTMVDPASQVPPQLPPPASGTDDYNYPTTTPEQYYA